MKKGCITTIKSIRKHKNITQEELADRAGLDRTYISGVERGVRNITLDSLECIVDALRIKLPEFLTKVGSNIDYES